MLLDLPARPNNDDKTDQGDREHIFDNDEDCWCNPTLFFDGEGEFGDVWVHQGPGEELPPSNILIRAVADAIADREE